MKEHFASKSSLFLMELILAILFFSLASAVCCQLFVRAHTLEQEALRTDSMKNQMENAAQLLTGFHGDMDAVLEQFPYGWLQNGTAILPFDASFHPCEASQAVYYMKLILRKEASIPYADIAVTKTSEKNTAALYELSVCLYTPLTRQEVTP